MLCKEIPGRGLGLVASRQLAAGEVILSEFPLLVYPQASAIPEVCSFCLRWLATPGSPAPVACSTCATAKFCSADCASVAGNDAGSHSPLVCRATAACNSQGLSDEDQTEILFLVRAVSLLLAGMSGDAAAASRSSQLSSLSGKPPPVAPPPPTDLSTTSLKAQELHGRVCRALAVAGADPAIIDAATVAALLERDAVNAYGISAPGTDIPEEERRLRGSAIYASASKINHECLPNAARFDAFDAPTATPGGNTAVHFRMLHALPAGEEVTQSYFPLTWSFLQRQERCREQYGFACRCPRCAEEATWCEEDASMEEAEGGDFGVGNVGEGEAGVEAYIHVFLLKYVCPKEGCGGTMAPLPNKPEELRCNVCDCARTEAQFLAELEAESG